MCFSYRKTPYLHQNIDSHLLYAIRNLTSIYLLNSIANNASNIDVYVRFTVGQNILVETGVF